MSTAPTIDLNRVRSAWNDRINKITASLACAQSITQWDPAADGDDLTAGHHGYTLTVDATALPCNLLARYAGMFALDSNRHVEVHPAADPTQTMIMVWWDMPAPGWCGARTVVEPDGITVFCDQDPFHHEPYEVSDEDGEKLDARHDQHHAPIPYGYGYGKQGDHLWDVGPLHAISPNLFDIHDVLTALQAQPLTDEEAAERDQMMENCLLPQGDGRTVSDLFNKRRFERHWTQVRDRLALQFRHYDRPDPDFHADELMANVAMDIEHDNTIVNARKKLWEGINDAHGSARVALRALADLDDVFDVEYENSETVDHIKSLLANVRRDSRAALALMPTDRNGGMKPGSITG